MKDWSCRGGSLGGGYRGCPGDLENSGSLGRESSPGEEIPEPGETLGILEPGGTLGIPEPGGTLGTPEPGGTLGSLEPGGTLGTPEPGGTLGISESETLRRGRGSSRPGVNVHPRHTSHFLAQHSTHQTNTLQMSRQTSTLKLFRQKVITATQGRSAFGMKMEQNIIFSGFQAPGT